MLGDGGRLLAERAIAGRPGQKATRSVTVNLTESTLAGCCRGGTSPSGSLTRVNSCATIGSDRS
jgi:hypothetical protein